MCTLSLACTRVYNAGGGVSSRTEPELLSFSTRPGAGEEAPLNWWVQTDQFVLDGRKANREQAIHQT